MQVLQKVYAVSLKLMICKLKKENVSYRLIIVDTFFFYSNILIGLLMLYSRINYFSLLSFVLLLFLFLSCSDDVENDVSLQLEESILFFGPAAGEQNVCVTSDGDWEVKVTSGSDWCTCVSELSILIIKVAANNTGEKRIATVLVSSGNQKSELRIEQESVVPELEVQPSSLRFTSEGGVQEIEIDCNVEWKTEVVTSMTSWVSCDVKEGTNDVLVVTVESNPITRQRVAMLRITAAGLKEDITVIQDFMASSIVYPQVETSFDMALLEDEFGTTLPDFSHVGYMGSEVPIPDGVPVKITLTSPGESEDATAMIQKAIDELSAMPLNGNFRGTILLRSGIYRIQHELYIQNSGIVLRGEGSDENGTKLIAAGVKDGEKHHRLINVKGSGQLNPSTPAVYNIKDDYVPVGRFWVTVDNVMDFHEGDHVTIFRPGTDNWIHDLRMDQIYAPGDNSGSNWTAKGYNLDYERVITRIIGDTLHFDNPILMSMEKKYGGGAVYKSEIQGRLSHCGIENMQIISEFDETKKDKTGYFNDEDHSWTAVDITKTEHSWIRNVTSRYFAYGLAEIRDKSLFVTIENCKCLDGVAKREGGRLYSFLISDASACLVRNCETSHGRHDCITGSKGVGPNVFVNIKIRNAHADTGPHQRWNVGTLYDNIDSDGDILVQDRGNWGTGHGWAGANQYLWNCIAKRICVQSPWASAKNYSIGSKGTKSSGTHNNTDRPDGVWVEQGKTVFPQSLFEAQLELRIRNGRFYHSK